MARRRFDNVDHYASIQSSAVMMENLSIQRAARELREIPLLARFFISRGFKELELMSG